MRLPVEFFEKLRASLRVSDIVRQKVILTKKGGEFSGVCPFHSEKTPSFTVNDAKRFYHCFGCGAHGDLIKFVSESDGLNYAEAAKKIAQDNGIELPKMSQQQSRYYEESDQIYSILELANQFFVSSKTKQTDEYLVNRGLNKNTIADFSIGYAPGKGELEKYFKKKSIPLKDLLKCGLFGKKDDGRIYEIFNNRIMFPIRNIYNKIVGFGGRAVGDYMPKYINSPETLVFKKSEIMYGENIATGFAYKDNYSIIVEGYMDVVALHQAGFKHAVASLGTSVTEGHVQKLWRNCDEIVSCLDADNAGQRASARLIDMTLPNVTPSKSISFIQLPAGMDPDDYIKSNSPKAFRDAIGKRKSLSELIWDMEFKGKRFNTAESKAKLEKNLFEYSNKIANDALKTSFKRYFKEMIWNNLYKKKKFGKAADSLSEELIATKNYSEIEFAEHAICAYLINFPEVMECAENSPNFENKKLSDFKDWLLEFKEKDDLSSDNIKNNIKNSGFSEVFQVLSKRSSVFLDVKFWGKDDVNHPQIYELLCKKHYLLMLKKEYSHSMSKDGSNHEKSSSYIKEIQKVSLELNRLTEELVDT